MSDVSVRIMSSRLFAVSVDVIPRTEVNPIEFFASIVACFMSTPLSHVIRCAQVGSESNTKTFTLRLQLIPTSMAMITARLVVGLLTFAAVILWRALLTAAEPTLQVTHRVFLDVKQGDADMGRSAYLTTLACNCHSIFNYMMLVVIGLYGEVWCP